MKRNIFSPLLSVVVLICISSVETVSQTKRAPRSSPSVPGRSVGIGEYAGVGPSSNWTLEGPLKILLSKFDRRSGDAEGVLEVAGPCDNSDLSGLIDSGGVTLTGLLECRSATQMILIRCTFSGPSSLSCTYNLRAENSSKISERGKFLLSKVPIATATNTVTRVYSEPLPQPRRKYAVRFPEQTFEVDLAMVNRDDVYLRASAYSGGSVVQKASPGDLFAMIDRTPVNGMIKVVSFSTGLEGWLPADDVETKYNTSPRRESLLDRTPGRSNRDPTVTIKNDTSRSLTFGFGGQTYKIGPFQSLSLNVKPGTYKYYVATPNVVPIIGEDYLGSGYDYNWTFYITTQEVR